MSKLLDAIRKAGTGGTEEVRGRRTEIGGRMSEVGGRKDLRGCSGCKKKMLAKMKAKRRGAADERRERSSRISEATSTQMTTDKEPHT